MLLDEDSGTVPGSKMKGGGFKKELFNYFSNWEVFSSQNSERRDNINIIYE